MSQSANGTHYIILQERIDPVGFELVCICHTQEQALKALAQARQDALLKAIKRRKERFDAGEACGRMPELKDFDGKYDILEVPDAI